jgi:hypothetical protein
MLRVINKTSSVAARQTRQAILNTSGKLNQEETPCQIIQH